MSTTCCNKCLKEKCPMGKWVVLDQTITIDGKTETSKVGKCADCWTPFLLIEVKSAVQILANLLIKK